MHKSKNSAEKAIQIQNIASIYSSAQTVLTWLGPASDNSDLAMDGIKGIEALCRGLDISEPETKQAVKNLLPKADDPVWAAVKLFDRDWFKGLWIMQEAVVARRIRIYCGNKSLPWSTLEEVGESMMKLCPEILFLAGASGDFMEACVFRLTYHIKLLRTAPTNDDISYFAMLLGVFQLQKVKEPLDGVYGILGLLDKTLRESVVINYKQEFWAGYVRSPSHSPSANQALLSSR